MREILDRMKNADDFEAVFKELDDSMKSTREVWTGVQEHLESLRKAQSH